VIRVGIVGATGYVGSELFRILHQHPSVTIEILVSDIDAGKIFSEIYPHFNGVANYQIKRTEELDNYSLDCVFLALPHGVSMEFVKEKGSSKYKIIDMSGDFRLKSASLYEKWYNQQHIAKEFLTKAVYGLPEIFRTQIRRSKLIANPGCYATSTILSLAPLIKNNVIQPQDIIVDAKSGTTGAGVKLSKSTHFSETFGNFSAYSLSNHRHTPEMQSVLKQISSKNVKMLFTPHLLPIDRGILTTIYTKPVKKISAELLREMYLNFYHQEHFVRIINQPPNVKNVRGSNYCDIFVTYDIRTNNILTISAIDNLIKGAAGQAVQNMNILFNLIESTALNQLPLYP
jgi:N-acetyl-gamma-glutamyl-phosphate reductase